MSINNLRIVEIAKKRNELNGLLLNINHVLYIKPLGFVALRNERLCNVVASRGILERIQLKQWHDGYGIFHDVR